MLLSRGWSSSQACGSPATRLTATRPCEQKEVVLRAQSFVSSAKPTVQLGDPDSFPWEQAGRSFQALLSELFRSEHDSRTDFSGS